MRQPGVVTYGASHTGFRPSTPGETAGTRQRADSINDAMLDAPAPATTTPVYLPVVVVTRHAATLEWLRSRWGTDRVGTWEVISHVLEPAQVAGKIVVGNLPMHLAAKAAYVGVIEMPMLHPDQRGHELTLSEMYEAGARLNFYRVVEEQYDPPIK